MRTAVSTGAGTPHPEPLALGGLEVGADVRGQGADRAGQLDRRAGGIEAPLGGVDLLGVGRLVVVLLLEARDRRPRTGRAPRPAARRRPPRGAPRAVSKSSSGPIAISSRSATGPESRPSVSSHHADAGALVAGHDRPLDRRRPAPARQQRRVDVDQRQLAESSGSRISCPKAQTTTASGRAARIRSSSGSALTSAVWGSSIPSSAAASAAGGGGSCGRGRAAVGRGDDERRAVPAPARPRRTAAANSEVPRKAVLTRRCGARDGSGLVRFLVLLAGGAVAAAFAQRPQRAPCAGRAAARSRISTPSRWSISCWRTRASRPGGLERHRLAVDVEAADAWRAAGARRPSRPAAG